MSTCTFHFWPEGIITGLYNEVIDLHSLGWLRIKRVSSIEFDSQAQLWRVFDLKGRSVYYSASRQDCLRWEQECLIPPDDNISAD